MAPVDDDSPRLQCAAMSRHACRVAVSEEEELVQEAAPSGPKYESYSEDSNSVFAIVRMGH